MNVQPQDSVQNGPLAAERGQKQCKSAKTGHFGPKSSLGRRDISVILSISGALEQPNPLKGLGMNVQPQNSVHNGPLAAERGQNQ